MRKYLVLGGTVSAMAIALSGFAHAQSDENFELKEYRVESNDCPGCGPVDIRSEQDLTDYLANTNALLSSNSANQGVYGNFDSTSSVITGPQVVFLNFDAGGEPTFPVCMDSTGDGVADSLFTGAPFLDHIYTQEERDLVQANIEADYANFNFTFTQTEPLSGDFTTLDIGDNDAPLDCSEGSNITLTAAGGISILFGMAEAIDFLNANMDDNAFADASVWEFLVQFGGAD